MHVLTTLAPPARPRSRRHVGMGSMQRWLSGVLGISHLSALSHSLRLRRSIRCAAIATAGAAAWPADVTPVVTVAVSEPTTAGICPRAAGGAAGGLGGGLSPSSVQRKSPMVTITKEMNLIRIEETAESRPMPQPLRSR